MAVLVTGALGQLGAELCRRLGRAAVGVDIAAATEGANDATLSSDQPETGRFRFERLDLTDRAEVLRTIRRIRPEAVINCAAYTAVDQAEREPELARAVNALAVSYLAEGCAEVDCALIQISTDYVFGGQPLGRPWREEDQPSPANVYARTKLEGEQAAAAWRKHIIVRTCGLYARAADMRAKNFVRTILRLAREGRPLRVVNDQHCTPSFVPHVAEAVLFLAGLSGSDTPTHWGSGTAAHSGSAAAKRWEEHWGIYHVTNRGQTTWYEFACEILRLAGLDVPIEPISSQQYPALARRPQYSVLDTSRYHALGGPPMPDWQAALGEYFR